MSAKDCSQEAEAEGQGPLLIAHGQKLDARNEAMDINQLVVGAPAVVALLICVICCGGMAWMMMHGHEKKPPAERDDNNRPPSG